MPLDLRLIVKWPTRILDNGEQRKNRRSDKKGQRDIFNISFDVVDASRFRNIVKYICVKTLILCSVRNVAKHKRNEMDFTLSDV